MPKPYDFDQVAIYQKAGYTHFITCDFETDLHKADRIIKKFKSHSSAVKAFKSFDGHYSLRDLNLNSIV